MRSGYCMQGGDNPAMHAKCTQPGRCLCDCHQTVETDPAPVEETTVPAYACPECDRTFEKPQGLGAHRARLHGYRASAPAPTIDVPEPDPDPEPDDQADDHQTTALYAITGWYGGLYIDLTVDTGGDLIDPDILRAVIGLASALEGLT